MIQTIKTLLMRQDELVARGKMEAALLMYPTVLFVFSAAMRDRRRGHGGFSHHIIITKGKSSTEVCRCWPHSEYRGGITLDLSLLREALNTIKKI